nr:hypothetical protein [Nocardia terpenica]
MPRLTHQRRRARTRTKHPLMQRLILRSDRPPVVVMPPLPTDPRPGTIRRLTQVTSLIGMITPTGQGHLRPTMKTRQRRQAVVDTVGVTPRTPKPTVVDLPPIRIGTRVRADEEPVTVPQRVLHRMLILGPLELLQMTAADHPSLRQTIEHGRSVAFGDVVADPANLLRAQPRSVLSRLRRQPELLTQPVGDRIEVTVGMPRPGGVADVDVQVRFRRIRGMRQIDQHPITRQQPLTMIEHQIRGQLRPFPHPTDLLRRHTPIERDMHLHTSHRDRPTRSLRITPETISGPTIRPTPGPHRSDPTIFRRPTPVELSRLPRRGRTLHLLRMNTRTSVNRMRTSLTRIMRSHRRIPMVDRSRPVLTELVTRRRSMWTLLRRRRSMRTLPRRRRSMRTLLRRRRSMRTLLRR